MDYSVKIAVCTHRTDKEYKNEEQTWQYIKDRNRDPVRTDKTVEEYFNLPKDKRDELKDHGGFVGGWLNNGSRKSGNVMSRSIGCLDADNIPEGVDFPFLVELAISDAEYFIYSTHSHTQQKQRYRVIILFSREVSEEEYPDILRQAAKKIGMDYFDESTYQANRMMYWASCPSDSDFVFIENEGKPLDPDKYLSLYEKREDNAEEVVSSRQPEVTLRQQDPLKKPGVIGAFCRAYTIEDAITAFLSDVYKPSATIPGRYDYIPADSTGGGIVYDDNRFFHSHHATDPAHGKSLNAFDLVRTHRFPGTDEEASFKAMLDFASNDEKVKIQLAEDKLTQAFIDFAINGDDNADLTADTRSPALIWFDKVQRKDIEWYWYPYIRKKQINSIVAPQGTGKSYLICKLAVMASQGRRHELPMQDRHHNYRPFTEPETTLYLNAEDDPEEDTVSRLESCGANKTDLSRIATVELEAMSFNFYHPQLEEWIKEAKPSMVVFDPIQQFFIGHDPHGKLLDMNDSSSVRPVFNHVRALAIKYNFAAVFIMHPNKNSTQSALYSAMGSNDMTASPRSAVYIGRDPEDAERRIISITKANSVPDRDQKSLAYRWGPNNGGLYFDGESDLQSDDIRDTKRRSRTEENGESAKPVSAVEWLEYLLTDAGGYMEFKDIEQSSIECDITRYALYDAKKKCSSFIHDTGKGKGIKTYWYIVGCEPPEQEQEEI